MIAATALPPSVLGGAMPTENGPILQESSGVLAFSDLLAAIPEDGGAQNVALIASIPGLSTAIPSLPRGKDLPVATLPAVVREPSDPLLAPQTLAVEGQITPPQAVVQPDKPKDDKPDATEDGAAPMAPQALAAPLLIVPLALPPLPVAVTVDPAPAKPVITSAAKPITLTGANPAPVTATAKRGLTPPVTAALSPNKAQGETVEMAESPVASAATPAPAPLASLESPAAVRVPDSIMPPRAEALSAPASAPASASALHNSPAERPADFTQIVDRLIAARDAASSVNAVQPVRVSLRHAEFGKVSLNFLQDQGALTVALSAADPGFARAVQAAAPPQSHDLSGDAAAHFSSGQPSYRPQDASSAQSQTQDQPSARATPAPRPDRQPTSQPNQSSDGEETPRRRGLFA